MTTVLLCTQPRKCDAFSIRAPHSTLKSDTWKKLKQPAWEKTSSSKDTLLYFYISIPYMNYLVHLHFIVDRTLSIFSFFHIFTYISTYKVNTLFPFWLTVSTHTHTLSLSLSLSLTHTHTHTFFTSRDNTLSLSLLHFDFQHSTPRKSIHSVTFFFLVLSFRWDLLQSRTQPQKFRQTPKETTNQHGRRHVPPSTRCYISIYRYLTWNT